MAIEGYERHPEQLVRKLSKRNSLDDMSLEELSVSIDNLSKTGLIELDDPEDDFVADDELRHRLGGLTAEGFEVIHDREISEKNRMTSEAVAFFTFALALTAILQAVMEFRNVTDPFDAMLLGAIIVGVLGLITYGIYKFQKAGILDF